MSVKIELKDIVQEYRRPDGTTHRVIDNVSLNFEGSAINMLLGPSGCGKSTLMRMMGGVRPLGFTTPSSGTILIDGEPCTGEHPDAVMVFQKYTNRPDQTIRENIAHALEWGLWKKRVPDPKERKARVDHALESVGLADKANHRTWELSGGQNQRVALARALALRPRILLMDEPFGALDAHIRLGMQKLLVKLWEEQKCLVVFVTHDVTEALVLGDRVTVLSANPAHIAMDAKIDEPRSNRTELWLRSTEATTLSNRIIDTLRAEKGSGQVRVTV